MKKNIVGIVVLMLGLLQLGYSQTASANTLEAIQEQQEQKKEQINTLQREVNSVLEEVSVLSQELTDLEQNISDKEVEIEETEVEVQEQEELVEARLEQARQRVQSLQLNEVNQNIVLTILEAESLSDLFNRALVIKRLTDAGNQQIELAEEEVQKLADLREHLVETREELKDQQAKAVAQKEAYDEKVANLHALIQENQSELTTLVEREAEEVARIEEARRQAREEAARAAARREAEERAAKEAQVQEVSVSSSERSASSETASTQNSQPAQKTEAKAAESKPAQAKQTESKSAETKQAESKPDPAPKQSSGKSFVVQATGYSTKQPNLSTHTATGIDLRVNPRVIAVDPSVIPLGSMVEVEGMGVYIAGDTGGAIRGNIIDIHFETVGQALNWGRRSVRITILNR
ncbi:3D domain-containing protein [Alkalibacterium iburiense]